MRPRLKPVAPSNRLGAHRRLLAAACLSTLLATSLALAEGSWPDLKSELYGDRFLAQSDDVIRIDAPYRTTNDARTDLHIHLSAPEGLAISGFALILDENPMPVSAQIEFANPVPAFAFSATMRINGPTGVHAVAEMENGQLFVAEGFVKTSGQGACSAPPGTDPKEALATLGQMELAITRPQDTKSLAKRLTGSTNEDLSLAVDIKHPSHSGMQMDQISLLFIPARYVETLKIDVNGAPFATMTGSISLSENPSVTLSIPSDSRNVRAILTDTDGTTSEVERSLADY